MVVDRERLQRFWLRFGIGDDPSAFERFRTRVVQGARASLDLLLDSERTELEQEFAFRNGSDYVQATNWGLGGHVRQGAVEELEEAQHFQQLVERVQHLLWAFETLRYFERRRRYSEREFAGIRFAAKLEDAISASSGVNLRVHVEPDNVELIPAGSPLLDDAVRDSLHWLAKYPDVQKEFRQALAILADKRANQFRQAQDSLRYALEKLLKLLLNNNTRLEDQGKPLKEWLSARGVHDAVRDVAVQIMILLTKQYQNSAVKHDSDVADGAIKSWKGFELEYMIYQYATLFRLLSEAATTNLSDSTQSESGETA